MIYNVAQLMKAPVGTSQVNDFHDEEFPADDDIKVVGPVSGHVRMRRTNQGLLVDGWVELTLELECDRCLNVFEQSMRVQFEEQFYPTVDVVTGLPLASFDQEEIFPIDGHHELDLTEAIRQNALTALPMVTLCREDCKGLCPRCGHDLNLGPCECKPEVDARLSVLEKLLQNGTQS
ncbi:MAG TPA: DUF177 domain-containing protein [Ktedonobacteraceae bacterium]|nr:DUF177 domain-containing protein [Ktedonobacteraceae bacterium]